MKLTNHKPHLRPSAADCIEQLEEIKKRHDDIIKAKKFKQQLLKKKLKRKLIRRRQTTRRKINKNKQRRKNKLIRNKGWRKHLLTSFLIMTIKYQ